MGGFSNRLTSRLFLVVFTFVAILARNTLAFQLPTSVVGRKSKGFAVGCKVDSWGRSIASLSHDQRPEKTSPTALSSVSIPSLPIDPNSDLIVGMAMIAMTTTPYVVGLFFPKLKADFFFGVYKDETAKDLEASRNAEIEWKLMYVALGLALTVLQFFEVFAVKTAGPVDVLRDSYVVWSIFYTAATAKIRYEATRLKILKENRLGIQIWHSLVVVVMWGAATQSPLLVRVANFFLKIFSF